ncbi:MAG TPA: tryptophan synthase subunit alpha [Rhizomicrobium sp.]|jgi:tryptophan synthase alpha chain|nr:tryptophan synthase subunit alpha [Rhizomicrobium sp.]
MNRIAARFEALRRAGCAAFVPFITAGDPDAETSLALLEKLPAAGADLIELGVPFSDPMADGPAIQASSQRALAGGMTLAKVLDLVRRFRARDTATPLVLMGYYNPIHAFGTARFAKEAALAGVDGLITVDLPPEEDEVLRAPAAAQELDVIRLATPTTDERRLDTVLNGAGGFLYYVSIAGITGTKSYSTEDVRHAIARLKARTELPCAVGFGIRTPEQAAEIARFADGAVVGSAIVARIGEAAARRLRRKELVKDATDFCAALAEAVHAAREREC